MHGNNATTFTLHLQIPVTGPTNNMQASECDDHCNWNDNEVFYGTAQDVEFTAEFDQLESWINDVKKVFKEDLFENGKTK